MSWAPISSTKAYSRGTSPASGAFSSQSSDQELINRLNAALQLHDKIQYVTAAAQQQNNVKDADHGVYDNQLSSALGQWSPTDLAFYGNANAIRQAVGNNIINRLQAANRGSGSDMYSTPAYLAAHGTTAPPHVDSPARGQFIPPAPVRSGWGLPAWGR